MAGFLAGLQRLFGGGARRVTATRARELLQSDPSIVVLDVRQAGEFKGGHLPGAKHSPVGLMAQKAQRLDKDAKYLVYCRSGARSSRAARAMSKAGITEVYNLHGGILAWEGMGFPVEKKR